MKVKVQTLDGGKAGSDIELNDEVFGVEPRADILHRVVTWQLEKRRGTARGAARALAKSTAPARSSAGRRAAAPPATAIAAPRSSSAAARRTARASATSIRR